MLEIKFAFCRKKAHAWAFLLFSSQAGGNKSDVVFKTGVIRQGWIPVPEGYTRDECLFFVSHRGDGGGDCHNSSLSKDGYVRVICHVDTHFYLVIASHNHDKIFENNVY